MAVSTFTPLFQTHPSSSLSESISPSLSRLTIPRTRTLKYKPTSTKTRVSVSSPLSILSDPFVLQIAEALEDSLSYSSSPPLQKLRDSASESLLSTPWPSRRDEPFRFTDTSFIKKSKILPISAPPQDFLRVLDETQFPNICVVDGYIVNSLSTFSDDGVFVGSLSSLEPDHVILKRVSELESGIEGDLFWSLNGVGTPDVLVVYVPQGVVVEDPLHLRFVSDKGEDEGANTLPVSNPRVLVLVEKGGEIGVIEEFVGGDGDKCYWANSVMDVVVGEGAKVCHSYIQNQSLNAAHTKWTSVRQESASTYELIEVSTGGKLSRHNLHVQQVGPDTVTELSTFHLAASDQTQDLHSRLILDHPRGKSRQLHKCIVAHSLGQAVFDGNVQVNREAQQTDAGQLTRSLLLEPRATVNVKPNLQIIADDVKCSHGAAISDLEENQLFYFQARGVDLQAARKALIFSFAAEVIERFPNTSIQKKAESHVKKLLNPKLSS